MIDAIERKVFQTLYDHYPEWEWSPYLVSLGNRISTHQAKYKLDLHLLTVTNPSIVDRIKAGYAYARHETLWRHELVVTANADYLFQNCYFLNYSDAHAFSRAVCFLRFVVALIKWAVPDCSRLVFAKNEGYLSAYEAQKICLNVVYYDEIGYWLPSPEVVPSPEMIAMQNES